VENLQEVKKRETNTVEDNYERGLCLYTCHTIFDFINGMLILKPLRKLQSSRRLIIFMEIYSFLQKNFIHRQDH